MSLTTRVTHTMTRIREERVCPCTAYPERIQDVCEAKVGRENKFTIAAKMEAFFFLIAVQPTPETRASVAICIAGLIKMC